MLNLILIFNKLSTNKDIKIMENINEIVKEWKEISQKYHELSHVVDRIHKSNLNNAKKMLPTIKDKIKNELFSKGLCFKGNWVYIDNGDKSMGGFHQLNDLGEVVELKSIGNEIPGPIWNHEQLDTTWVEERILDRYFDYYQPKDTLKNELNLEIND